MANVEIKTDLSGIQVMYETTFLVEPTLNEGDYKEVVSKFEKMIKNQGGEIINLENWGVKKLAYPIQNHTSAYYCYIEFNAKPSFIAEMEQEYLYDERIIRYLTVRVDKYHAAFNKKRREQGFGKKEDK